MNLDKLLTIDFWSGGWAFFIFLAIQCTFVAVVGIFFSAKAIQKTVEEGTRDIRGQLAEVRGQLLSLKDILRFSLLLLMLPLILQGSILASWVPRTRGKIDRSFLRG